jgi:hypothetical protein
MADLRPVAARQESSLLSAISIVYGRMLNAVEISDSFMLLLGAFRD